MIIEFKTTVRDEGGKGRAGSEKMDGDKIHNQELERHLQQSLSNKYDTLYRFVALERRKDRFKRRERKRYQVEEQAGHTGLAGSRRAAEGKPFRILSN